jgi:hypothetical protein
MRGASVADLERTYEPPPQGSPAFLPVCPRSECGVKNWPEAKWCGACGAALYPSLAAIERVRRDHEAA